MDSKQILSKIKIVSDTQYLDNLYGITPEIREQLTDMAAKVAKKKNSAIKELNDLIKKYPGVPAFRNYLSSLYAMQGNAFMSEAVNIKIRELFPDYVHGFLNEINTAINKDDKALATQLFENKTDISLAFPQRDSFHNSEIIAFYHTLFNFSLYISNIKQASLCLDIMNEVVEQFELNYDMEAMERQLYQLSLQKSIERRQTECLDYNTPELKPLQIPQTEEAPQFSNPIIQQLYCNDTHIDAQIIADILALPKDSLFEDLKKVVYDSMARQIYFEELDWNPKTHTFLFHALFLLAEIKHEDTLPVFLDVLRHDYDYSEFWMGDYLTDSYWNLLYPIAKDKLADLYNYVVEPNGYTYSKSTITQLLEQLLLNEPDRKQEIIDWCRSIFNFWLNNIENKDIIDHELIAFFVSDVVNMKLIELIPEIKLLFDNKLVAIGISGTREDCLEDIEDSRERIRKSKIHTCITDRYEDYKNNWGKTNDEYEREERASNELDALEDFWDEVDELSVGEKESQHAQLPKIGRNDPCICGSGKKYKKCCGK